MTEALLGGLRVAAVMLALFSLLWLAREGIRRTLREDRAPERPVLFLDGIRPMAYRVRRPTAPRPALPARDVDVSPARRTVGTPPRP